MHLYFISYIGFCSMEEDKIHNGATLRIASPILLIPWLLMPWRLKEPGHQQAWYWSPKLKYSLSGIRRVNIGLSNGLLWLEGTQLFSDESGPETNIFFLCLNHHTESITSPSHVIMFFSCLGAMCYPVINHTNMLRYFHPFGLSFIHSSLLSCSRVDLKAF